MRAYLAATVDLFPTAGAVEEVRDPIDGLAYARELPTPAP